MYAKYFKRPLDFVLSLVALVVLSPLLLVVSLLVRTKLGKPIFFKQERPGLNEEIFTMYKFRTMTNEENSNGQLLPDSERLPQFGQILRSTSLDELPELFNILKGEMSIVGPRPQLIRDMFFMTVEERKRHTLRPGLTGWAQINGRNNISWEDKLSYDLTYLDKVTFLNDCKIVLLTIGLVLKRENIKTEGMHTAEDYGDYLLRTGKINQREYEDKIAKSRKSIKN